jgi:hypothetical protein
MDFAGFLCQEIARGSLCRSSDKTRFENRKKKMGKTSKEELEHHLTPCSIALLLLLGVLQVTQLKTSGRSSR